MKFYSNAIAKFVNEALITFPDDFLKVKLYPKNTAIAANPTIFAWLVLANVNTVSASDMMSWFWSEMGSADFARCLT